MLSRLDNKLQWSVAACEPRCRGGCLSNSDHPCPLVSICYSLLFQKGTKESTNWKTKPDPIKSAGRQTIVSVGRCISSLKLSGVHLKGYIFFSPEGISGSINAYPKSTPSLHLKAVSNLASTRHLSVSTLQRCGVGV